MQRSRYRPPELGQRSGILIEPVWVWQASAGPVRVELSVRGGEQRTLNLHGAAAPGALLTEAGRVTAGQSSRVTQA